MPLPAAARSGSRKPGGLPQAPDDPGHAAVLPEPENLERPLALGACGGSAPGESQGIASFWA